MIINPRLDRERAILASVIFHNIGVKEEATPKREFRLEKNYFSLEFHKLLVRIITYFQKNDNYWDEVEIAETLQKYKMLDEALYLDVLATTLLPLQGLKHYYNKLKEDYFATRAGRLL